MKFNINQISPGSLTLSEEFSAKAQDLETEIIRFRSPIKVRTDISKTANVISVFLKISGVIVTDCSLCLEEFTIDLDKDIELNLPVDKTEPIIDLDPEIREEIILNYPIKPLCRQDCKGLCLKCGKNLNEGGCSCGST